MLFFNGQRSTPLRTSPRETKDLSILTLELDEYYAQKSYKNSYEDSQNFRKYEIPRTKMNPVQTIPRMSSDSNGFCKLPKQPEINIGRVVLTLLLVWPITAVNTLEEPLSVINVL